MALKVAGDVVPKDAVILSENDAVSYQWEQIFKWPNKSDVWAFRYGLASVSGTAAVSAGYIIRHHRRKLKLREYGYLTSMFAVMVAPAIAAGVAHAEFITNDLLLFKTPCPVCLQTKAAAVQLVAGLMYPLIFSPLTCTVLAIQGGFRIPAPPGKLNALKMWYKFSKPIVLPLTIMIGLQILCATSLTYIEAKQFYELNEKLLAESGEKSAADCTT
ncbi:uncharacterized protein LOC117182246 [Belonocnema kinseyi]|uniref:uncharacterized protein LOC117182246 n=1 Tax=Belonocnema kinseyi TaxID=2817044 RepID=UPI00143D9C98|nr:uncharacterized protein LOC117182246 [Belonocnema kinseyi]